MQGRQVASKLDIVREAGGPMTALVKEVSGVEVTDKLTIELLPAGDGRAEPGTIRGMVAEDGRAGWSSGTLLSGIEIAPEGW